jgi:hypothetical protein
MSVQSRGGTVAVIERYFYSVDLQDSFVLVTRMPSENQRFPASMLPIMG